MRFIFFGPPGAGKGTQSERARKNYNIVQLSTGELLRKHIANGTELGKEAQLYMKSGELVPDLLMIDMIKNELKKPEFLNGYILDGFPRTLPQAESLDLHLKEVDQKLDCVLVLNVPDDELIRRLSIRRTCKTCGKVFHLFYNPPLKNNICDFDGGELFQRDDDNEETIAHRLQVYNQRTKPLIEYYTKRNLVKHIKGTGSIEEIYQNIKAVLDNIS